MDVRKDACILGVVLLITWFSGAASGQQLDWATRAGGSGSDQALGIAVDGSGNTYVTGTFTGTASFAPGTSLTSAGAADVFVAKYDGHGTLLWATRAGGTQNEQGSSIAVDSLGNSYLTGTFSGSASRTRPH